MCIFSFPRTQVTSASIFDRETEANSKMVSINSVSIPQTRTVLMNPHTHTSPGKPRGHVVMMKFVCSRRRKRLDDDDVFVGSRRYYMMNDGLY